jgi:predicted O-linked N-acetylglucosamine transferase (SPINDLY family)
MRQIIPISEYETDTLALAEKLIQKGSFDELISIINNRLSVNPFDEETLFISGLLYQALGRYDEAISSIELSNYKDIRAEIYWNVRGECEFNLGEEDRAVESFKQSILSKPSFIKAYINLSICYLKKSKLEDAKTVLEEAVSLERENPYVNLYLALAIYKLTLNPLAISNYVEAALKVDNSKLDRALCLAFLNAEAENDHYRKNQIVNQLMHSFPNFSPTWVYKAHMCFAEGNIDEGLNYFKKAILVDPRDSIAHSKLIMVSHYIDKVSSEEIFEYSQNYYRQCIVPFLMENSIEFDFRNLINKFQENPKLRIGFVSADLKMHPVFFWVSSLLKYIQKDNFEIYCYANNAKNPLAESLQCHKLEYIYHLSDRELAEKIYADEIHILVDLSGHTAGNRLNTFALKAAPLQITWLGHIGTQGLPEIDYVITDEYYVKHGEEHLYVEKIHRMPKSGVVYPADDYGNLHINHSLARTDNIIVFGSINHARKINDEVLHAWGQVLQNVNNSIIIINNSSVSDIEYQKKIIKLFQSYDIHESRVVFKAQSNKDAYFLSFLDFDIALDPFPYGGATTTHETLMLSVPLVTLTGNKIASRLSSGILEIAGFSELIANTKDEYINKLVDLAKNPERILNYKKNIREKYLNSAAADMKSFSKDFFNGLKDLWEQKIIELKNKQA